MRKPKYYMLTPPAPAHQRGIVRHYVENAVAMVCARIASHGGYLVSCMIVHESPGMEPLALSDVTDGTGRGRWHRLSPGWKKRAVRISEKAARRMHPDLFEPPLPVLKGGYSR